MCQLNVDVSSALELVTVNDVPALFAETVSVPTFVTELAVSCKKIKLDAVTAVVEIVTVPPVSVPVPAMAAAPPVGIETLPGKFTV
jgi:hypothetical protein